MMEPPHHMPLVGGGVSPGGIAEQHLNPGSKKEASGYSMTDRYGGNSGYRSSNVALPYHSYSMYEDASNMFDR